MTGLLVAVAIMATAAEPARDMTVPFDSTADAPRNTCNQKCGLFSLMSACIVFYNFPAMMPQLLVTDYCFIFYTRPCRDAWNMPAW